MSTSYSRLPWSEDLESLLLYCVIVKGAHICSGKRISQTWCAVNEMFFDQEELSEYKASHYKKDSFRKLRDKYVTLLETIQKDIESGNQSGKEGELNTLYSRARQILNEISDKEASKAAGSELREKLDETERQVLATSGIHKRKQLDGEVVDITSKRDRQQQPSFEEKLFMLASPQQHTKKSDKIVHPAEENFEIRFKHWIDSTGKTFNDLLVKANAGDSYQSDIDNVSDLGLMVLVSIYCTRNADFSAQLFKNELRQMDLSMKFCSKIYNALQDWRRDFERNSASTILFTPPAVTNSGTIPRADSIDKESSAALHEL